MLVSVIVFILGLAFIMGILYRYFGNEIKDELRNEASYLVAGVEMQGEEYLENVSFKDSRVTYISQDGTVLFDSEADTVSMDNHSHREEVVEAAKQGTGEAYRVSNTLSEMTIYYALRLSDETILRVSTTQYSVLALIYQLIQPVLIILVLMIILSVIFAARISKKIVQPVNELDLEHPEENQAYEEVAPLLSKIHRQNRQIKEQLDTARQQQAEFSIITENMQEGLLVIDRYTMILSGNSSVWKLFQTKEKTGESIYSLDRSEEFRKVVETVLEGRHGDSILKFQGGHVRLIANPVYREGETVGAVLLLVDVTEQVERETLRREFSANVSHELKTPLTSISGFAEIIQDGFVKPEDIKVFAGRIYKEAQRLIQLVEDVIKISQLDEGEVPYQWQKEDLYNISKSVLDNLREVANRRNIQLYIEGERTILRTVRPIFEEALYNLCENAIKYNKENGNVSIVLTENKNEVRITVKDTGIGIPAEDQSRVFERFYRVDKSHSKEIGGTGLGLSIVKHGVTFLGGSLELISEEGEGTEISMVFPKETEEIFTGLE
ncbi:MAG TPA: ATP-binding protein [Candidatus Blautia faecavium]|uniref:histidine kinase n=1 Tax=Candidatus Blautia faecavium TaxID=2838487 RepID=A0A9D2RUK7_9FIRM|nr:ATP-binding protein [Candidatus Blautia faecavium]